MLSVLSGGIKPLSLHLGYGVFSGGRMSRLGIGADDLMEKVNENMCPVFLFLSQGDSVVSSSESIKLALALAQKHISFEIHCYVTGDHALSLGRKETQIVNGDYATWFNHSLRFIDNIQSPYPLTIGDISEDLKEISINSRIGALMYHEKPGRS